jgi:ferredoxin
MTCGGDTGDAARYIKKLCREKGLDFMGLAPVVMPENYIALFDVPDKSSADAVIRKAEPVIQAAAERIRDGVPLPALQTGLRDRFMSSVVNPVFYAFVVKAKGFYTVSSCTGCGVCATLCPLNNVRLESGKPVWGDGCTHCMACICRCPAGAIEYKKNSQGKPRYVCPEI